MPFSRFAFAVNQFFFSSSCNIIEDVERTLMSRVWSRLTIRAVTICSRALVGIYGVENPAPIHNLEV